jgi:hypothetical protein
LRHPEGFEKSISAFSFYIERAGNNEIHIHPWYMYFHWLLFFSSEDGSFWSEGIIAVFAFFGVVSILSKKYEQRQNKTFLHFILSFVVTTTLIFSLIPYKTPWNLLTFWFGFIFISAIGVLYLYNKLNHNLLRITFVLISILALSHLGWQSYQLNFQKYSDVSNPYVYAHPVTDVFKIVNKLEQLASHHKDGHQLYIQIIAEDSDYWPLPWYLRKFDRIGWWNKVDFESVSAPIIITQPVMVDKLIKKLYELPPPGQRHLYLPLFDDYTELRPGKEFRGYIRKDLFDVLYGHDDLKEIPKKK